ncbi:hypothetical protein [Listonella phage phiHSIC]|uniref:hypothetical protein n=1 Tax=Listonella phage phiHSIC TaxID=310539 RepID=UPI00004C741C|nr:hypothetical protein LPPPVgp47 [Listonella phage phiHSIC]AAW67532.1 hypothetical protein [Listonella phage phiHSIC]
MSLENTKKWFEAAIPEPTIEQACIQVGCHLEEVAEMLAATGDSNAMEVLENVANHYKTLNEHYLSSVELTQPEHKQELLDSLADQIVTAVGVAHMMGFDILGALDEVNRSNFSKLENGKPVFDANGKITKGKNYIKPDLKRFV